MKTNRSTNLLFVLLLICFNSWSQEQDDLIGKFKEFNSTREPVSLKSRLFIPENYDSTRIYPVVLTLHGMGECGSDNISQIRYNNIALTWAEPDFQATNPCFILSPQCPQTYLSWIHKHVHDAVFHMLDSLIGMYSIDTERIYITGLSLGGQGTWDYLINDSARFAAGVPVCGWITGSISASIPKLLNTPVWYFHGNLDDAVTVINSRIITKEFIKNGSYPVLTHVYYRQAYGPDNDYILEKVQDYNEVLYSELPNVYHDAWNTAYYWPIVKTWLFRQKKYKPESVSIQTDEMKMEVTGTRTYSITTSESVDSISIWLGNYFHSEYMLLDKISSLDTLYEFHSEEVTDDCYARLRFMAHDTDGFIIGRAYSDTLFINNEGNAPPFAIFWNDYFLEKNATSKDTYLMELLIADPERDSLDLNYYYSTDNGNSFSKYSQKRTGNGYCSELFNLNLLPKTDSMVVKAEISDSFNTVSISTLYFKNNKGIPVIIKEETISGTLNVYPNPSGNKIFIGLTINSPETISINLFDTQGRLVKNFLNEFVRTGDNKWSFDITEINPGNYILKVSGKNHTMASKILNITR